MKKTVLSSLAAAALAVGTANAQVLASDNSSNYSGGWTDGSNGGFGFTPWQITVDNNPPTYFAGNFIGDPNFGGVTGMGTQAFGLYANPDGTAATVTVRRGFSALNVGETFSVQWGVNWDSGAGNKGLNIFADAVELININMGAFPGNITFNGSLAINGETGFGTDPMTWSFTHITPGNLLVTSTGRTAGSGVVFTTNIAVAAAPNAFSFYTTAMQSGDQRQSYFNNPTVVPEPSTYALLTLGALALGGYAARRRARK